MQLEENKLPFIHLFQTAAGSYFYDVNCNDKIKNWETSTEAYTAEEIAAFKAAKERKRY